MLPSADSLSTYPTLLDVLKDVVATEERDQLYKYPLNRASDMFYDWSRTGKYNLVQDIAAQMPIMMPISRTPYTLYRGQSRFFDKCYPSLYRYGGEQLKYQTLLSRFQIAEMFLVMQTHPVIKDLASSCLRTSKLGKISLPIIYDGLAQHYGISTEYLDLTNNIWTASFFAATRYKGGEYSPCEVYDDDELAERFGVMYRMQYFKGGDWDFSESLISPLGLQYFNRPGRQCAFVRKMSYGENFNSIPYLERIFFRHDNDSNRLVFTLCHMGKQFFPDDSLADVIDEIKSKNRFCWRAVEVVRNAYYPGSSLEMIADCAALYHFELTDNLNAHFDSCHMQNESEEWFGGGRKRFVDSIMVMPIRYLTVSESGEV